MGQLRRQDNSGDFRQALEGRDGLPDSDLGAGLQAEADPRVQDNGLLPVRGGLRRPLHRGDPGDAGRLLEEQAAGLDGALREGLHALLREDQAGAEGLGLLYRDGVGGYTV